MAEQLVPRLTTRSSRAWLVGTAVLALVAVGVAAALDPTAAVVGLPLVLLVALTVGVVASARTRVDAEAGTVSRTRWLTPTRTVRLAEAVEVRLLSSQGGQLLLSVRDPGGAVTVLLLALTQYVERSQSAEVLRALAEATERHAPAPGDVPRALRLQADHVAAGGTAAASPLAPLVDDLALRAAGAAGATGSAASLARLLGGG